MEWESFFYTWISYDFMESLSSSPLATIPMPIVMRLILAVLAYIVS